MSNNLAPTSLNTLKVSYGLTNRFIMIGVVIAIAAVAACYYNLYLGCGLGLLSIFIFLVKSGIELDASKRRIRIYDELFTFNRGVWVDLEPIKGAKLYYYNLTQHRVAKWGEENIRQRYYTLSFIESNEHAIEFYVYTSYPQAREMCELIEKVFHLPVKNEIEERIQSAQKRRRR
jgi:hypothetical protein